jgi:hypothetical protein
VHPNHFQVNEAWIVFKLNDRSIRTAQDGSFNCFCLMDAASCFILGEALIPTSEPEPSKTEVLRLLRSAWAHKQEFPVKLFVPSGQFPINLPEEAESQGIEVVRVPEGQLIPFIGEARAAFRQYLEHGGGRTSPQFPRRGIFDDSLN